MNDDSSNKTENNEHVWTQGKAVSKRISSESDMSDQRKNIIRYALQFDIVDIRSYTGYKGDLLVEITTMVPDVVRSLKKEAETLGFEIVIQKDVISLYKVFCISPSFNIYDLKAEF